jgi:ectoine hydroxylase-related dioxygenase (phytanoyl-CoA dioxygenase family)
VLIYSGSVLHGGGANISNGNRRAVLLHYTLGWLRQEENQYLSCPPEIACTLDPDLRRLIGYQRGGPLLGFYSPPTNPGQGPELVGPDVLFADASAPTQEAGAHR